jgi:hypothetical protein
MKTSSLTNTEQLALLKGAYFEALVSYNESYNQDALFRLNASEDAYMSFIECSDARSFG